MDALWKCIKSGKGSSAKTKDLQGLYINSNRVVSSIKQDWLIDWEASAVMHYSGKTSTAKTKYL